MELVELVELGSGEEGANVDRRLGQEVLFTSEPEAARRERKRARASEPESERARERESERARERESDRESERESDKERERETESENVMSASEGPR